MEKDAAALGLSLEDFVAAVGREWDESSFMGRGSLPAQWRVRLRLYHLRLAEPGWWVDIGHRETLAAVRRILGEDLHAATGCAEVTLAELHAPNREVTTRIASWLRGLVLDDGTRALGIRYNSKFGGECFAYWLRRRDDGLGNESLHSESEAAIILRTDALHIAAKRLGMRCF